MLDKVDLQPNMAYQVRWLILGLILLLLVLVWSFLIIFLTRKRTTRTIDNSVLQTVPPVDLASLQSKYLALIDQVTVRHNNREISSRQAHQELSYLIRIFVYEARGQKLQTFTLSDLKRTSYTKIAETIEKYYIPEFSKIEAGNVLESVALAKEVISTWR